MMSWGASSVVDLDACRGAEPAQVSSAHHTTPTSAVGDIGGFVPTQINPERTAQAGTDAASRLQEPANPVIVGSQGIRDGATPNGRQKWTGGTSCGPAARLPLLLSLLPGKQPSPPPAEPSSVPIAPRQRQPGSAITKTGSTQRREPLFFFHRPEERDTGMWESRK
ncbi:hypothetical protein VTG60DRAFT_4100 [Thermothelomyces hinnuleus]